MSHILIADDDQFLTQIHSQAFEKAGYRASTANNGKEVVEKLTAEKPDLVLLDLLLPGMDGIGVLKFIRSNPELENLPVFIVSNSTYFSGMVNDAWSAGATKFIRKGELSPKGMVDEVRKTVPPSDPPQASNQTKAEDSGKKPQEEKPASKSGKQGKTGKRVLIADDDRTIHSVLVYFMGQAGYEIESAFNGLQALEMARQEAPDVLILDVTMPVKDGFETLKEWQEDPQLEKIPVIMLTASRNEENEGRAMGGGATHYLTKPFSPQTLVKLTGEAAAGGNS